MRTAVLFTAVFFLLPLINAQEVMRDAQSTSGPERPDHVSGGYALRSGDAQVVIPDVPAYIWYNGCGPTAAGMVLGYWDGQGLDNLVEGSAASQTPQVDAMISSSGNYNDYCLPLDNPPNPPKPDKSEPPVGDEHPDDCLADFMETSQSYHDNYYGYTWFSHVQAAVEDYVVFVDPHHFKTSVQSLTWKDMSWSLFRAEIDAGRPMILLVDTDGDGYTDHFVTAIGYAEQSGKLLYGCRDTWDNGLHWYEYKKLAQGQAWGIFGFITFRIDPVSALFKVPDDFPSIQEALDASWDGDQIVVEPGTYYENIDFKGKAVCVSSSDGAKVTTIDGGQKGCVATFAGKEGPDSVLQGFTLTNGVAAVGGGVVCTGSSPSIRNNNIVLNVAQCGGGIGVQLDPPSGVPAPIIEGNLLYLNYAGDTGGIHITAADGCVVRDNSVLKNTGGNVGGISVSLSVATKLDDNKIDGNTGCGVRIHSDFGTRVAGNTIRGNSGDGLVLDKVTYGTIIENNVIGDNASTGIAHWSGPFGRISGNVIEANLLGGVLCGDTSGMVSPITNNFILKNKGIGGICCIQHCRIAVLNNTVTGNSAIQRGGGFGCYSGSVASISNTIFRDNKAPLGPEIYIGTSGQPSVFSIDHSNVEGGQTSLYAESGCLVNWGKGILDADPLFENPPGGDYHISYLSPCRNRGDGSIPGLPKEDFEGDPRIAFGIPDMGADEFHPHLYFMGETIPGGVVETKVVGVPGTGPVILWAGSGVLDPPKMTKYGTWYLDPPLILEVDLGVIPSPDGILVFDYVFPNNFPVPWDIPLQAGIGPELSNLFVMKIE